MNSEDYPIPLPRGTEAPQSDMEVRLRGTRVGDIAACHN
jgi:hypothetical protein